MKHFESCMVEKTIHAGKKTEVYLYYAPTNRKTRGPRRTVRSKEHRAKNLRTAILKVERLIYQNFCDNDLVVVITYRDLSLLRKDMPSNLSEDEESAYMYTAAQKELQKFFDRLRRACQRAGVPLRYVGITSDYDANNCVPTRIHHHVIVNCEVRDYLHNAWGNRGQVKIGKIYPNHDKFPLAAYFLQQSRHIWGKRCFVASKNLKKPNVICRITLADEPPPPPPDAFGIEIGNRKVSYYQP